MPALRRMLDETAHDIVADSSCSRPRSRRAGASGNRYSARVRAAAAGAAKGLRSENASRCRTWRRPTFPGRRVAAPGAPRRRRRSHIVGAHARGHERLVGVAEGGVGDEQALFFSVHSANFAARVPAATAACPAAASVCGRRRAAAPESSGDGRLVAFRVRIAVDDDIAKELQQLGGAVAARLELEELRRIDRSSWSSGPSRNSGKWMTFSRNGIFVFTPRMRNSRRARSMR